MTFIQSSSLLEILWDIADVEHVSLAACSFEINEQKDEKWKETSELYTTIVISDNSLSI
jgi:hypothetical protein